MKLHPFYPEKAYVKSQEPRMTNTLEAQTRFSKEELLILDRLKENIEAVHGLDSCEMTYKTAEDHIHDEMVFHITRPGVQQPEDFSLIKGEERTTDFLNNALYHQIVLNAVNQYSAKAVKYLDFQLNYRGFPYPGEDACNIALGHNHKLAARFPKLGDIIRDFSSQFSAASQEQKLSVTIETCEKINALPKHMKAFHR